MTSTAVGFKQKNDVIITKRILKATNAKAWSNFAQKVGTVKNISYRLKFRKEFFQNSTIGGLRLVFGLNPLSKHFRILWLFMWLMVVAYAFWLCSNSIIIYLKFDVKTSIRFEEVDELEFPAITICNENMFRRSFAGGSFFAMMAMANFFAKNPKDIYKMALEVS